MSTNLIHWTDFIRIAADPSSPSIISERILAFLRQHSNPEVTEDFSRIRFKGGIRRGIASILAGEIYVSASDEKLTLVTIKYAWLRPAILLPWPIYILATYDLFSGKSDFGFWLFTVLGWISFYWFGGFIFRKVFIFSLKEFLTDSGLVVLSEE